MEFLFDHSVELLMCSCMSFGLYGIYLNSK
nr:MAG TPA: hypothetical protein [Myoviridae sp. ctNPX13]